MHNITEFKNAEFALKLETQHKIPQVSIDQIMQHTSHLISHHVSEAVKSIKSHLQPKSASRDLICINSFIKGVKLSNIDNEYTRKILFKALPTCRASRSVPFNRINKIQRTHARGDKVWIFYDYST